MAVANASMVRTGSIISRIAAGAGLAVTGIGFVAIKSAANFQQSMNILQAVSGATTNQMNAMRTEAIGLGKDFNLPNVSAKDAAEAMVQLSKAGLSTKDVLGSTRGVLQLGLAANLGFADSADIVARSLKMFNLSGDQSSKIANLLAAGANASTASIGDLALGLQNAGGQFASAHQPIETLVTALTELTDRGLSGELAGTALKTMMIRLESPTKKAAGVMKELGVSIYDSHKNVLPLRDIIGQFQVGLKGASDETKNMALNTIFGTRANQAMFKLLDAGVLGYDNYQKRIVGTNAAQKMAEAQTKGLNGAVGALGSAFETLAIEIGTPFLGALEGVV
ncbi:MAG TPA: phage tail tape measure protein, partial [Ktedonobacteraceae bacterium]